jgi:hypothetical protein
LAASGWPVFTSATARLQIESSCPSFWRALLTPSDEALREICRHFGDKNRRFPPKARISCLQRASWASPKAVFWGSLVFLIAALQIAISRPSSWRALLTLSGVLCIFILYYQAFT